MRELHCSGLAVSVVEVFVNVEDSATLLSEGARHAIVVLVHVEAVHLVQLPVLHLAAWLRLGSTKKQLEIRFFQTRGGERLTF